MGKKALITGITGQDGSYLAELLLKKDYIVYGLIRRSSSFNTGRIDHLYDNPNLKLIYGDISDSSNIGTIISDIQPDEIYNLAAQSHVKVSFDVPVYSVMSNIAGTINVLEAIRKHSPHSKYYQASSSEMYGKVIETPQTEKTPFYPRSPYGCSKVYSYWQTINYRESYNIFASNGILFNHESNRRGETFVTKKITRAATRIKMGLQNELSLGNIDSKRDWGFAGDYCINKEVPILTTDGWKFYNELNVGDEIINFNIEKNCLETDSINKIIETKCDGKKVIINGKGVNFKCTYNHRIFYQKKSKISKGGWSDWKCCTSKELYDEFKDRSKRSKYDYRFPHFSSYNKKDYSSVSDDEIYLIGCLLAEGCMDHCYEDKQGRGTVISLSQSLIVNENIHRKIKNILKRLNITYRENNKNNGVTEWVFNAESSKMVLGLFDTLNIHVVPRYIYNFSQRQFEILFTALMDCDGSWGALCYSSKRYLLAVDFQTIAHLAGYRTSDKIGRNNGCYIVYVIAKRKKYVYVQDIDIENDGVMDVWCVNTNNGTIISRDNDSIFISGNCEAMYLILQHDTPDDFIIASGETHSVREFLEEAFGYLDLDYKKYVKIDQKYFRPAEVDLLLGDPSKAKKILNWEPKVSFKELVKMMVDSDLVLAKDEKYIMERRKNEFTK